LFTDVSGQRIGPVFKGQEVVFFLDSLTLQDGTDMSRNVSKGLPHHASNISEEHYLTNIAAEV
jgi:hypothetical protein